MKKLLLASLLLLTLNVGAQTSLPVIRATSKVAFIVEGAEDRTRWSLSPAIRPDVYTTSKSTGPVSVQFCTNVDTLRVNVKPGRHSDFVVLLNGKDSCWTRIECPALKSYASRKPVLHDTIPFVLTDYNNIKIKVLLDQKDTLDLKFDSGATDFLLTRDLIEQQLKLPSLENHTFQMGALTWSGQYVYPVEVSGHGTVGRFGWNLFDGYVVEIDYEHNRFVVHSRLPMLKKGYARFPMEYVEGLFCIAAELQFHQKKYKNRFLFDTGYQRTAMLDEVLVREQQYPADSLEVIKKVVMQNGQGKEIPVLTVNNEKLNLGQFTLNDVPVQLLSSNNPAGFKTHILGNEVLKRFNTVLDFQHNVVYLKPNGLYRAPYAEQKQGG